MLGVSRSTVSLWVRDIDLTPEQHEVLRQRNPIYNSQLNGSRANFDKGHARRRRYQQFGRTRVLGESGGSLYVAGCMLYWAEGDKARNSVRLSNSDPEVARLFLGFLRECFGVRDEQVRISCNLFADHAARQREIEQFWLDALRLPASSLRASAVNRYSRYSQKKRKNRLPYGTCRVAVHSTETVQAIYGSIQEFAGFERPEWIDC